MAKFRITFRQSGISDPRKEKVIEAEYFKSPFVDSSGSRDSYEFFKSEREAYSDKKISRLVASMPAANVFLVEEIG